MPRQPKYRFTSLPLMSPEERKEYLTSRMNFTLQGAPAAVTRVLADYLGIKELKTFIYYILCQYALDFKELEQLLVAYTNDEVFARDIIRRCKEIIELTEAKASSRPTMVVELQT